MFLKLEFPEKKCTWIHETVAVEETCFRKVQLTSDQQYFVMCDVLSAPPVSEARRSVPHHSQHSDERPELPFSRHLHHPPVPDESVSSDPAGTNQFINYIRNKPQKGHAVIGKELTVWWSYCY